MLTFAVPFLRPIQRLEFTRRGEVRMSIVRGLREAINRGAYNGILLDQYGVLHNGVSIFPPALDAIRSLSAHGVKIAILSNSSRRASQAFDKLEEMGVDRSYIQGVVTSGELMHDYLSNEIKTPKSVLHINWGTQRGSIDLKAYSVQIAALTFQFEGHSFPDPKSIDIVLCHGVDGVSNPNGTVSAVPYNIIERYLILLAKERADLPFVCANPDLVTVAGSSLRTMPGSLAKTFKNAGGLNVKLLGKPFEVAYQRAVTVLKEHGASKFLAIGDSLAHDVLGAHKSNIDSVYIAGGIDASSFYLDPAHAFDGKVNDQWSYSQEVISRLIQENAPALTPSGPSFVMPFLKW